MRLQARRQLHSSGQALGGDVDTGIGSIEPISAQEAQKERLQPLQIDGSDGLRQLGP